MICFTKVALPYGWLGNMSPHPTGGYRTAEAMFQAGRFEGPGATAQHLAVRNRIKDVKSPMQAKFIAKANRAIMLVEPRSISDLRLMRRVLEHKLVENAGLPELLLDTGTHLIVEDVSARPSASSLYWGGVPDAGHDKLSRGQNHLGRLWMILRNRLNDQWNDILEGGGSVG